MCLRPVIIRGIPCKCGVCRECIIRRSQDWAIRLYYHQLLYKYSLFLTLTYSDSFLPVDINLESYGLFSNLRKSDLQHFFARVRSFLERKRSKRCKDKENYKISYFAAGEYGDKFRRPHYHVVLFFNCPVSTVTSAINNCWNLGFVQIKPITNLTNFRYLTEYLGKQLYRDIPKEYQPFNVMSKGIGKMSDSLLLEHIVFVDSVPYLQVGKRKLALPKYYLNQLGIESNFYYEDVKSFQEPLRPVSPIILASLDSKRVQEGMYAEKIYYKRLKENYGKSF